MSEPDDSYDLILDLAVLVQVWANSTRVHRGRDDFTVDFCDMWSTANDPFSSYGRSFHRSRRAHLSGSTLVYRVPAPRSLLRREPIPRRSRSFVGVARR